MRLILLLTYVSCVNNQLCCLLSLSLSLNKSTTALQQASISSALVTMLSTLWYTLLELYVKKEEHTSNAATCLPAMFLAEILLTLRKVQRNTGLVVSFIPRASNRKIDNSIPYLLLL